MFWRKLRPKKEASEEENIKKQLQLLKEYFSLEDACSSCGDKITEKDKEDGRAVVAIAVEWFGEAPRLLRKLTVCDLCAAELPAFELPNPLNRAPLILPPEARKQTEDEVKETALREAHLSNKSKALVARRQALEASLPGTSSAKRRDKITSNIREVDEQLKLLWEQGLHQSDLEPLPLADHREFASDSPKHTSDEQEPTAVSPTGQDYRTRVREFLASPYAKTLPAELRPTAHLYAAGTDETEIAERRKISQPTVSRQLQTIKNIASRGYR